MKKLIIAEVVIVINAIISVIAYFNRWLIVMVICVLICIVFWRSGMKIVENLENRIKKLKNKI